MLPLRKGQTLSADDTVLTGTQGRAEWSLNPDSYFQVGPSSRVRIYDIGFKQRHFDILRGEIFVIVNALDREAPLELDTPLALITITKSGSYRVRVSPDGDTEATVVHGNHRNLFSGARSLRRL